MRVKTAHWSLITIFSILLISSSVWWASFNFLLADQTNRLLAVTNLTENYLKKQFIPKVKPPEVYVKGIYLSAPSVANAKSRQAFIDLLKATDLNAVVFDIKDATGYVFYSSRIPEVMKYEARKPIIDDLPGLVAELHQNGIYVIARQVIFVDPVLTTARPELGIIRKGGPPAGEASGVWRNYRGEKWADPTVKEVWDYNLAIAREVISAGVDEINFDYTRFPSDGPMGLAEYHNPPAKRTDTISEFIAYMDEGLKDEPAYVSVDFFGLVMDNAVTDYDLGIGQHLAIATSTVDYIYPMAYPSHYAPGHLGFSNPAQYPYQVVSHGLKLAQPMMTESSAKLRVWLQDFDMGAVYDIAKVREQIRAVEESPITRGWVLWNARNVYNYY
ncbi:MAG: putative glycoside hydrolase [bacterium]